MARKSQIINEQNDTSPKSSGDVVLDMILARLEMITQQQVHVAQQVDAMKKEEDQKFKAFEAQMVRDKNAAIDGLKASIEQLYQNLAAKQLSPEDFQKQLDETKKAAVQNAHEKRTRFEEILKTAPIGQLIHYEPYGTTLTVNGITKEIVPGVNFVPAPFVEAWNNSQDSQREAIIRAGQIAGNRSFGDVENWRDTGKQGTEAL